MGASALLLVLVGLLAGCGGSGAPGSGNTAPASTATSQTEPAQAPPAAVKTAPGTAEVTLSDGSSHAYRINCYLHPTSLFLSTPNVPLAVKQDGSYTDDVSPRDGGPFIYLIADPPGEQVHGRTIEYTSVRDTENLLVQGEFGDEGGYFGGSSDYLQSAELEVDAQGLSGRLEWTETDGTGFTARWECG